MNSVLKSKLFRKETLSYVIQLLSLIHSGRKKKVKVNFMIEDEVIILIIWQSQVLIIW